MQGNLISNLEVPFTGHRHKLSGKQLDAFFQHLEMKYSIEHMMFVCIGTDRSTGDALGPLVGTRLAKSGLRHVIGTLDNPCDASNLEERLAAIPEGMVTVAIDACLGHPSTVGHFLASDQPLLPAESVGKPLPAVGQYSIAAVVNVNGPKPYWTLQTTSLRVVMNMADELSDAIIRSVL
ncbi:spore protease YyaC [Paenibacillus sp. OSY-SE]|uniref:spore protease YyaC n=1 Tax=Paenibacillus sp. OSY-SE TaxID=1196323 RepID=UPI000300BB69|nr:spore protease YyaC [Paenibacillus sp. OSY-SE]